MGASLRHRGPDDHGLWIDSEAGIGFAHRRLRILDLSEAGRQPMRSADGRFVINFNGEIFNHADLRRDLEGAGRAPPAGWRGHCDTEVLVEAISAWGLDAALDRAVGQFAFALWDGRERRLTLVRDRFGEKPLYYGWAGRDFLFASELKAFRQHPDFVAEVDRRALALFMARNYVPAPFSIYRQVFKLQPGCLLEVRAGAPAIDEPPAAGFSSSHFSVRRYWSQLDLVRAGLANPIADEGEALAELESALARALAEQTTADVPVGLFLSGGIDSSTLAALHRRHIGGQIESFTIGVDEPGYDESPDARAVARQLGTRHHELRATPGEAMEVIPQLAQIYDEPFADSSQIPTFLVSRFARQRVTVALSGDGGDELFGGYRRYWTTARMWSMFEPAPRPLRRLLAGSAGLVPAAGWDLLSRAAGGRRVPMFGDKVRRSLRIAAGARDLPDLFEHLLDEWSDGSPVLGKAGRRPEYPRAADVGPDAPAAVRMMYWDSVGYLPDDILCKVDRASMANSLEVRAPYLDHRVAEVAARIPLALKISGGSGKHALRQLLYRDVPRALFERPKAGFAVPVGAWIKGPLRPWAEELLDPRALAEDGWLEAQAVTRRWNAHLAGTQDCSTSLWGVLMFRSWQRAASAGAAEAPQSAAEIVRNRV